MVKCGNEIYFLLGGRLRIDVGFAIRITYTNLVCATFLHSPTVSRCYRICALQTRQAHWGEIRVYIVICNIVLQFEMICLICC